jgi:hypothetical protein
MGDPVFGGETTGWNPLRHHDVVPTVVHDKRVIAVRQVARAAAITKPIDPVKHAPPSNVAAVKKRLYSPDSLVTIHEKNEVRQLQEG